MTKIGKYALVVIGASIVYALALVASAWFLKSTSGLSQPVQVILALLPVIPGAMMVWAHIGQVSAMDEYLRKIQLDSLAIAAAGTAFLTLAYGSLEAAGFPKLSMFFVSPLIVAIWVTSNVIQLVRHTRGASRT